MKGIACSRSAGRVPRALGARAARHHLFQLPGQVPLEFRERRPSRRGLGVNHQIERRQIFAVRPSPINLAKPSLEPCSYDSPTDFPAHGHSDPRTLQPIASKKQRQMFTEPPTTLFVTVSIVAPAAKPLGSRQGLTRTRNLPSSRHLTRRPSVLGPCVDGATKWLAPGESAFWIGSHASSCADDSWAGMCVSRSCPDCSLHLSAHGPGLIGPLRAGHSGRT